jgi:DNA polymerase (family 10)
LDALRQRFSGLTILQGSEVNIKKDGDLDLTPQVRSELDYVIGSVHSSFTLDRAAQTTRVLKAVEGGIDILGHPTGRLLGERPSIDMDFEKVAQACADRDVLLEINASPFRLDLWGDLVRTANEIGCRFTIDSDAHTVEGLHVMGYGVTQARRGMLEARNVVTTRPAKEIGKYLGHAKKGA